MNNVLWVDVTPTGTVFVMDANRRFVCEVPDLEAAEHVVLEVRS